jgi:hypothetical protein
MRRRLGTADDEQASKRARLIAAARGGTKAKLAGLLRRNSAA